MAVVELLARRHVTARSHKSYSSKNIGYSLRDTKGTSHPFRLLSDTISQERPGTEQGQEVTLDDTTRPVCAGQGENGSSR